MNQKIGKAFPKPRKATKRCARLYLNRRAKKHGKKNVALE